MKIVYSLLRYYFASNKLNTYIRSKDKDGLKLLLEAGCDPNTISYGISALQCAFMNNANDLAFELLEYKANPNISYENKFENKRVSLLEDVIARNHYERARLLILYGANSVENFENIPALQEAYEMYTTSIQPYQNQSTVEAYEKLADIWSDIGNMETDSILKKCYLKKADTYAQKVQELSKQMQSENSSQSSESLSLNSEQGLSSIRKRLIH